MLYMVIERFKPGAAAEIYRRLRKEGRHLVDGLEYVASWVDRRDPEAAAVGGIAVAANQEASPTNGRRRPTLNAPSR